MVTFQFLATEEVMEPLCKHPYICAFLDLHYSALKKIRSQMRDSVVHLTFVMLLLELAAVIGGPESFLMQKHFYVSGIGTTFLVILSVLDCLSVIGLQTKWLDRLFQNSLVMDRRKEQLCPPAIHKKFDLVMHLIGYAVALTVIACGWMEYTKLGTTSKGLNNL